MPLRFLVLLVVVLLSAAGCARHRGPTSPSSAAPSGSFDRSHGKLVFAARCQACHGVAGVGAAIGPALHAERKKHSLDEVIAIVKNPDPPMPRLFPGQMTQADVVDVSAYVESL